MSIRTARFSMQSWQSDRCAILAGTAIGDAFGMPTEMLTRQAVKDSSFQPGKLNASLPNSVICKDKPAGTVTDDTYNTQMMLDMLEATGGKIDTQTYLSYLKRWLDENPIAATVTGPSTSRALKNIAAGMPLEETGKFGTTNGASMKIVPLSLITSYTAPEDLVQKVAQICMPTHNTRIAIQGAAVVVAIASYVRETRDQKHALSLAELKDLICRTATLAEPYGFNWPSASLITRMDYALTLALDHTPDSSFLNTLYDHIGASMETIDTIPCVWALLNRARFRLMPYVTLASQLGGDTDTIGAIGGAICALASPTDIDSTLIQTIESVNHLTIS